MKPSNDVGKYEIEVTKMGQNYSFFSYSDMICEHGDLNLGSSHIS